MLINYINILLIIIFSVLTVFSIRRTLNRGNKRLIRINNLYKTYIDIN